jgi:FAD/FMN-containing dehydrogenase
MRLLGSKAQVREMELRIRKELEGEEKKVFSGPVSLLELRSGESRSFHAALEDWEKGSAMVLRLSLVPSRLGTLLEEVRELARRVGGSVQEGLSGKTGGSIQGGGNGAFGGVAGVRMAAHVGCGVLRVAFGRLPLAEGGLQELAQTLEDLRSRLEGEGGSLRLSTAPRGLMDEVGAWGTLGPVEALMEGLKREFDPAGILSPGRFGINVEDFPSHA